MEEFEEAAERIIREISVFPEVEMRLKVLVERLSILSPEEVALFFDILYRKHFNDSRARVVKGILVNPDRLEKVLGSGKWKNVYLASVRLGLTRVSRLFTNLPPHRKGVAGYDKEEEARMEHISLGERRSLAKRWTRDALSRLLSDPDPQVITNLLNNPRITEVEVLKIASKRPNSPEILKLLASHRTWSKRYQVIKALVRNPYTPPRVSIALLEFLHTGDIKEIAEDQTLHPQVRHAAKDAGGRK